EEQTADQKRAGDRPSWQRAGVGLPGGYARIEPRGEIRNKSRAVIALEERPDRLPGRAAHHFPSARQEHRGIGHEKWTADDRDGQGKRRHVSYSARRLLEAEEAGQNGDGWNHFHQQTEASRGASQAGATTEREPGGQ